MKEKQTLKTRMGQCWCYKTSPTLSRRWGVTALEWGQEPSGGGTWSCSEDGETPVIKLDLVIIRNQSLRCPAPPCPQPSFCRCAAAELSGCRWSLGVNPDLLDNDDITDPAALSGTSCLLSSVPGLINKYIHVFLCVRDGILNKSIYRNVATIL